MILLRTLRERDLLKNFRCLIESIGHVLLISCLTIGICLYASYKTHPAGCVLFYAMFITFLWEEIGWQIANNYK